MTSSPVYVQCVGYNSRIDNLKYDENNCVVSVSGKYIGESVTIEAIQNGTVLYSKTVDVENNDLLWFESTTPKGKPSPTNSSYRAEAVTMKHACSWLVFNFYGDDTAGNTDRPWNITKVSINNLAATGDAILSSTAEWPTLRLGKKNKTIVVYDVAEGTDLKKNTNYFTPSEKGIIVIPQEPTTISVTYNYLSQGANTIETTDDIKIEETATISLAYNGKDAWAPGTKYTYNVELTATGIKIAPTAATWEIYDADGDGGNNDNIPGTI
jgi:hypothetical protein